MENINVYDLPYLCYTSSSSSSSYNNVFKDTHYVLIGIYVASMLFIIFSNYRTDVKKELKTLKKQLFSLCIVAYILRIISLSMFLISKERILSLFSDEYAGNFLFLIEHIASFIFIIYFSYFILLLTEVYKEIHFGEVTKEEDRDILKLVVLSINIIFIFVSVILFAYDFIKYPREKASLDLPQSPTQLVIQFYISFAYLFFSSISIIYFIVLYRIEKPQIMNDACARGNYQLKYCLITLLCCACFFARSVMATITVFKSLDQYNDKDLLYFLSCEILPITVAAYFLNGIINRIEFYIPINRKPNLCSNCQNINQ